MLRELFYIFLISKNQGIPEKSVLILRFIREHVKIESNQNKAFLFFVGGFTTRFTNCKFSYMRHVLPGI